MLRHMGGNVLNNVGERNNGQSTWRVRFYQMVGFYGAVDCWYQFAYGMSGNSAQRNIVFQRVLLREI